METPAHDDFPTPAQRALDTLAVNAEDRTALDTLAHSDVLVPVPDDAAETADPSMIALPVLERPDGDPVVPVFTSEGELTGLLPTVSRYRMVPLGALASQWPDENLSLAIDGSSAHALTLTSEGVRTLLARPAG
ncbi:MULTISPECIES: SseB family protein [Streptomyces]|uniref:SseB family protein n=1 Tax=Streptomyces TaxID=1883 RepID=UPI000F4DB17D|nr:MULTISPECIES: SseB family protein [Streptomyces]RPE37877.1 type III secretion system (T3SS) SseB-like protein [Streptomyces sp. Ag109_O5-1]